MISYQITEQRSKTKLRTKNTHKKGPHKASTQANRQDNRRPYENTTCVILGILKDGKPTEELLYDRLRKIRRPLFPQEISLVAQALNHQWNPPREEINMPPSRIVKCQCKKKGAKRSKHCKCKDHKVCLTTNVFHPCLCEKRDPTKRKR